MPFDLQYWLIELWKPPTAAQLAGVAMQRLGCGACFVAAIFAFVGPLSGGLMAKVMSRRLNASLAGCIGALIFIVSSLGMSYGLRLLFNQAHMNDVVLGIISAVAPFAFAFLVARGIFWWLEPPGKPQWVLEEEQRAEDELMPFERRKREWQARRSRARKP